MNQVEILAVLREKGPMTAIQIAEALRGSPLSDITVRHRALSSVHAKLYKLKRLGFIESETALRASVRDGRIMYKAVVE